MTRLHPLSQRYGNDTTRRYPRTLADAFPLTDGYPPIEPMPDPPRTWRRVEEWVVIVVAATILIGLVAAVLMGAEWLPGGGK